MHGHADIAHRASHSLLAGELHTAVLGHAALVFTARELFAHGGGRQLVLVDAEARHVLLDGLCALLAEREVVLFGSAVVGVAGDPHAVHRFFAHALGVLRDHVARRGL